MLPTLLLAAALAAPPVPESVPGEDPEALFLTNCASCHGRSGAGDGWTKLDRPARSFQDGGFSYGNTEEALFRTITHGIPGTPMPSFATSLSDDQRRALATYVVTLGPPIEAVATEDTVLVVGDVPVVVRGYLPPIAEGAEAHPRGLLIGHPSGLTFEYRADDVRLLGVRQGGFVERRDWVGRGGTALQPLGKPVWLMEGGDPGAEFSDEAGPLVRRLRTTRTGELGAVIKTDLARADGTRVGTAIEFCHPAEVPGAAGFRRRWSVSSEATGLRARIASWKGRALVASFEGRSRSEWFVTRGEDGLRAVRVLLRPDGSTPELPTARCGVADDELVVQFERAASPDVARVPWDVDATYLSLPSWDDAMEAALRAL